MDAILTKYDYCLIQILALSRFRDKFPQYATAIALEGRTLVLKGYPHQIDEMIRASRKMLESGQVILAALGLDIYCISSHRKVFGIELPIYMREESMLATDTIETANGNGIELAAVEEEINAPATPSSATAPRYSSISPLTEQFNWRESDLAGQIGNTILVDGIGYIAPATSVVDFLDQNISRLTELRNQFAGEAQQKLGSPSTSRGRPRSKNSGDRPYRPRLAKDFKGAISDEGTLVKAFQTSIPEDKWELVLDGILAEQMPKDIKNGFFNPLVKSRVTNRRPEESVKGQMLAIARKLKEAGGIPAKTEAAATDAA